MRRPIDAPYAITTEFGVRDSYAKFGRHSGVDYAVPSGRPVYAPVSGNLTNVWSNTGGNMVVIQSGKYIHRLLHNSAFTRGNGWVNEGEQVARAGTTGLSTGPHVHWDVNTEGTYPTSFNAFVNPADLLFAPKPAPAPQPQGGNEVANAEQVKALYRAILHREGDEGGIRNYTGRDANSIVNEMLNSAERKNLEAHYKNLQKALTDAQTALRNEQNKPPKEVIKTVEKIVEKPVEVIKQVPVYTHDEETKQNVAKILSLVQTIFDYFKGQYKTFSKYVNKKEQ